MKDWADFACFNGLYVGLKAHNLKLGILETKHVPITTVIKNKMK